MYDVKGIFTSMCNKEMVDLDPLNSDDADELKIMIENHLRNTDSTVAKFILDDFDNQLKNFMKVFPRDYKRVLQQKKVPVAAGK